MDWVNAVIQGILLGGFYALFATGLSLAFGVMRFVNLAHGDLAVLAAYLTLSTANTFGWNVWWSMIIVVIPVMAIGGYVAQRGLFNRTLGDDPLPSILVTFGIGVVIQNALLEYYTATDRGLDVGSILVESVEINKDIAIGWFPVIILVVAVVVLGGLQLFLSFTPMGRKFRATADDPSTAQLMGINNKHVYGIAMAIAFGTVAIAGVFWGSRTSFAPSSGPLLLLFGFEAVVIGGLGSLWGTLVGGIVLGVAQTVGNQASIGWDLLTGHIVFLAILAFRPHGILGTPART